MRAGPGHEYAGLDEVINQRSVDVRGCAKDWCLIQYGQALGWVEQSTLETDNALPVPSIPAGSQVMCFDALQSGWAGGDVLRICTGQNAPAAVNRSAP